MANWSKIVRELLVKVASGIKSVARVVCTSWSWRFAANVDANMKNCRDKSDQMPLPFLMLPSFGDSDERGFYDMSKDIIHRVCLPEAKQKKCLSSKGWLLTVDRDLSITLLHPSLHVRFELPNIMAFEDWEDHLPKTGRLRFFNKFALSSSNLLASDYRVMVTYGHISKLAYFKPGQETWISIETWNGWYFDVVYYKDTFYAINATGQIMACDLSGDNSNPTVAKQVAQMPSELLRFILEQVYLVESDGALLVVTREVASYGTCAFQVFKVDIENNTWKKVKDIGNRALFLGHNSSVSVEVLDSSICKPNSIYFTDDNPEFYLSTRGSGGRRRGGGKDMGIYNIKNGGIAPHSMNHYRSRLAPPMWVEQSLN